MRSISTFRFVGIFILGFLSLTTALPLAAAGDKSTSLSDARAAVEANMQSAAGKAFDEQFGNDFLANHLAPLRECKKTAGDDLRSFWILAKLD